MDDDDEMRFGCEAAACGSGGCEIRIAGDLPDDLTAEVVGLLTRVTSDGIDATRDGHTVSGSVDAHGTMIEFSFTC